MALILQNANYIDPASSLLKHCDIKITESGLDLSEPKKMISTADDQVENLSGKYVLGSFSCAHHHSYSLLARGMPSLGAAPSNFHEILKNLWWKLDMALDADMIYASALGTAIECARNGVTFAIDHHSSPNYTKNALELIAKAFDQIGVGHLLCFELTDRNDKKLFNQGLEETESYLLNNQGLVGLHASFTLSDKSIEQAVGLAHKNNVGLHIHVAEDKIDQTDSISKYKKTVISRLNDLGVLNSPQTILAHCLHLSDEERKILSASKASIAVCTESNLNNSVGQFNNNGINNHQILLGTDGMHSDMIRAAQAFYFQTSLSLSEVYQYLKNSEQYLTKNNIKGSYTKDLIILDYKSPTPVTKDNLLGHFFYGLDNSHIESVISNGKFIVKNKKITTVNEEEILQFCRTQGERLWQKLSE